MLQPTSVRNRSRNNGPKDTVYAANSQNVIYYCNEMLDVHLYLAHRQNTLLMREYDLK